MPPFAYDGFGGRPWRDARNSYAAWLRAIAEARRYVEGVEKLPWWVQARDEGETADPERHPEARTFAGFRQRIHALDRAVSQTGSHQTPVTAPL